MKKRESSFFPIDLCKSLSLSLSLSVSLLVSPVLSLSLSFSCPIILSSLPLYGGVLTVIQTLFYIHCIQFSNHKWNYSIILQNTIQFFILKTVTRPPSCLTTRGTDTAVGLGCSSIFIFLIDELVFGKSLLLTPIFELQLQQTI